MRGHGAKIAAGMVALLAGTLLQLVFPYLTSILINETWAGGAEISGQGVSPGWLGSVDAIALVLLATVFLILVAVYFDMGLFAEVGERAMARLRQDVYGRLVTLPMPFFARRRIGELGSGVLADLAVLQEFCITDARLLLRHGTLALGGLVLMFVMSPILGLVVLATVPLGALAGWFFGTRIREISQRSQRALADSAVVVEESLHGMQSVKAFANERWEAERYHQRITSMLEPLVAGARYRALFICMILSVIFGAWVLVMWYGSRLIQQGQLGPGQFTAFMFYLFFSGTSMGSLAEVFGRMQRALGASERVLGILDVPPEDLGADDARLGRLDGEVTFDKVTFAYPTNPDQPVVQELEFSARAGQRIALVGSSGAGKSTVVSLLFRLYDPGAGFISIDGRSLREYPLGALRRQLALVPQEVILFGGTMEENIAYGRPGAPLEEVAEAAKKARLSEFIDGLPDGYGTRLGDRGTRLSGGQRQRVAIARAILRDPAILVLDEATSALDSESEAGVREALAELMEGRTTFVVAHRLSTVRTADQILVMREGRIVERGTHDELLAEGGFYRLLCEQQFGEG
ncbi:ABC transporter transmembrane domain-containing protein [soil metagenome]